MLPFVESLDWGNMLKKAQRANATKILRQALRLDLHSGEGERSGAGDRRRRHADRYASRRRGKISAFNGVVYVQVPDIQASCRKSTDLGGTLVPGFPFDLPDGRGAVALILDPAGHAVGMYSRTPLAQKTR